MSTWVLGLPHGDSQQPYPVQATLCSSSPGLSLALFLSLGPSAPPGIPLPCSPRLSHVTRLNPQWVSSTSTPRHCLVPGGHSSC